MDDRPRRSRGGKNHRDAIVSKIFSARFRYVFVTFLGGKELDVTIFIERGAARRRRRHIGDVNNLDFMQSSDISHGEANVRIVRA